MAYQLQPGLSIVDNKGALPSVGATDEVFVYPQPSHLNYGSRPNTMIYGTAPYMAGKGAPAKYIDTAMSLDPSLLLVSIRLSFKRMNVTYSPSLTWNARLPFAP